MTKINFRDFLAAEDGAVTVDWVVLTAALVGLGLAVMGVISNGIEDLTGDISTQLEVDHTSDPFANNTFDPNADAEGDAPAE